MAEYRFVPTLPDLIAPTEYESDPDGKMLRFRIRVTDTGVEIVGDCPRPDVLERILESLGAKTIEQMLCG